MIRTFKDITLHQMTSDNRKCDHITITFPNFPWTRLQDRAKQFTIFTTNQSYKLAIAVVVQ